MISSSALEACLVAGNAPAFDTDLVGPDGAGYRWEVQDAAFRQFSIAAPAWEAPPDDDGLSSGEGSTTTVAELVRTAIYRIGRLELGALQWISHLFRMWSLALKPEVNVSVLSISFMPESGY